VLRAHRTRQKEQRLAAGANWQEMGFVFTTPTGRPRDGCGTTRDFKRLLKYAGLPPFRFHDLRHSCASFLLAQGVAARVVMEILGHSDIRLTLNTYSHVMPSLQQDAADRMDALLRG
jgi:integrase